MAVGSSSTGSPTVSGNTGGGDVTYTSSNTSVATVDENTGVVTAVSAGSATITATVAAEGDYCSGTATANFTITCTSITPSLSYTSPLTVGGSTASPTLDKDGSNGAVTYSISATPAGCATINTSTGVVTPVAAGTATVTATVAASGVYCSGTATADITINAAACTPPAAPTGLAASSITTSGAALTITDGANTNNYDIYYSTSSTAPTSGTAATVTSTSKTKNLTGLTASTEYYVWVRSVCDESNKSAWVALTGSSFTTNASVPVISVEHSGSAVASGSTLDLGSVAVAPASVTNKAIDVLNTGTETLNISSIVISNTSGSAFSGGCSGTCPSVSASGTEQFNVSIAADLDPGTYTGTVTINSNDPSTPAYSFNITYTVRDASGEAPTLSVDECTSQMTWTNVAGAASYDVDICTGTTTVKEYEITGSSAASSMIADGDFFVEGKNYGYYNSSPYYFVLATTVDNNSTSKKDPKETTAVPGYMIIKMVNPETLYMTVNDGGNRKFYFEISTDDMSTWSTPVKHSEAADVAIDINKMGTVYARITCAEDSKWTRIHKIWYTGYTGCTVTNSVSKPYTPSSLTAGTTYYASVRANNSDWSDVVEFTAPAAAVSSVTADPAATSVTLTWPASAGATGYVVTIGGDDTEVSGTSATISGLTSSTNYTATVKAKTGSCLSAGTNVSFTTLSSYTLTVNYKDKTGASISGPQFRVGSTTSAGTATSENMTVSGGAQTISAIGTSGYGFDHWELSDGTRVAANEIDSVIASNVTLTAVFAAKECTDYTLSSDANVTNFNKTTANDGIWQSVSRNLAFGDSKGAKVEYNKEYVYTSKAFDDEVLSVSLTLGLKQKYEGSKEKNHEIQVIFKDGDGDNIGTETIILNSATNSDVLDETPAGKTIDIEAPAGTHVFVISHSSQDLGSSNYTMYMKAFSYCLKESVQKVGANITPKGTAEAIGVPVVVKMPPTIYYTNDGCSTKTAITAATASANSAALLSAIKLYELDANDIYQDVTSTYLTSPAYSAGTGDSIVVTFSHSNFDYLTQYKVVVDDTKIVNAECDGILNNVQVFKTMAEPKAQITIAESCGGTIFENGITRQSLGSRKTTGTLDKTFYIKNTGTKALNISSITLNNAAFTKTAQSGSTVAPGECETFTVRYTSQSAFETLSSTVTVVSNDDFGNETFTFTVIGATAGFILPYTYESGCTNPSASASGIVEDYDTSSDRRPEISGGTFIESLNIYSAIGGCAPNGNSAIEITDSNPLVINTTQAIGTITIGWASTGIRKLRIVNGTDIAYAESAGWENANECHELTATINDCTVKGGTGTGTATVKIVGLESGASAYIHYIYITPCDPEKQSADCNLINVESANMVDGTFEVEGTDAFITVNDCSAGVPPTTFTPTTLTVSPGATITPKVGVTQTLNAQGFVTYVVTAADGITKKTYHLYPECPIEFTPGVCYADSVKVDYLMYAEDKTIFVNGIVSADEYGETGCSMEVDPYSRGANYTIHYLSKEDKPLEGYKIEGPSQVCVGSVSTYRLSNAPESNNPVYKWTIKDKDESGFSMVGDYSIENIGGTDYQVFTGSELKLKAPNVLNTSGTVSVSITIDLDFTDALCEKLKGEASTTIKATDKAPNPVAWIENGCATQNGRLELVAHQIPASGAIPAEFVDATKFEWSFETTPSGQKVTPVLSQDSTYVLSMGTNAPGITATVIASNGCGAADPYVAALTYSAANTTWTGAVSSDWNNASNWTKQVPSECTDVTIPMVGTTVDLPAGGTQTVNNYPVISTEGICDEITFLTGAGVKGLEHLSYRRAYVKATYQRDVWYTLTNPLKEMVSGDYYYSGVPLTYMRKFDVLHSENGHRYTQEWTKEYTGLNVPLEAGEGFAYQVSNKSRTMSVNETPAPAGDQVVTFPRMTSDSSLVTELHKFNPLNGKLLTKATMLTKTENSYRFAYDGASVTDGVKTPTHASYPANIQMTLTGAANDLTLIGNPMMCHLDLAAFRATNSSVIKDEFVFWNGSSNTSVAINAEGEVSTAAQASGTKLPPMQGFFVKNAGNGGTLNFNLASHFVVDNGTNNLRSADASSDGTLYVTGNDGKTTSYLSVRKMEGASNGYAEGEDAEKIFNAYAESEIYTLAGGVSTDINHFSALPYEAPLAVNTTADNGTVELTFKGAESFENVNVILVNKKTGEEINLKDENKYKFSFTKDEAETTLVLRFTSDEEIATDAEQAEADASGCDVQIFTKGNNTVRVMSSSSNQIREVSIFDASGKLIAKEVATGNGVTVMDKVLNAGARNVVVTALTDNCVKTEILQLK
ncbi:MAG: Ig-like domain-containing protein [Paludibacteraceae bacterium]|nr:Ig-like domain-containing protein [Paludibacteraceae bacterium]